MWYAADGGPYGVLILAPPDQKDDVVVQHIAWGSGSLQFQNKSEIDAFKLSYRYYLAVNKP